MLSIASFSNNPCSITLLLYAILASRLSSLFLSNKSAVHLVGITEGIYISAEKCIDVSVSSTHRRFLAITFTKCQVLTEVKIVDSPSYTNKRRNPLAFFCAYTHEQFREFVGALFYLLSCLGNNEVAFRTSTAVIKPRFSNHILFENTLNHRSVDSPRFRSPYECERLASVTSVENNDDGII